MKKFLGILLTIFISCFFISSYAISDETTITDFASELNDVKNKIKQLENKLEDKDKKIQKLENDTKEHKKILKDIEDQPKERLPMKIKGKKDSMLKWFEKVTISGLIEGEFYNINRSYKDTSNNNDKSIADENNFKLDKAEIGINADVSKYANGKVLFLYEQDKNSDHVVIDEATILLGGIKETFGLYLLAGKFYPHFGDLNSWFITKASTEYLFEIQETAIQIGYVQDWFTVGAGIFKGAVSEEGHSGNHINSYFADIHLHNPENTLGGVSLTLGCSYLNNVGDTDILEAQVTTNEVKDFVNGIASYLVAEYDQFAFSAEYITALRDFKAGEVLYARTTNGYQDSRPGALNVELAYKPIEILQVAGRYAGTYETFSLYPEHEVGIDASVELYDSVVLSAEYMYGWFDRDNIVPGTLLSRDTADQFTMQLAYAF